MISLTLRVFGYDVVEVVLDDDEIEQDDDDGLAVVNDVNLIQFEQGDQP